VPIKCPECHSSNPETAKFCADCGLLLRAVRGTDPTDVGPDPRSGRSSDDIPAHTKTLETPFPQFAPGISLANRYEIIKELGKGGMGEVYLAEDTNLKRQVAIKVLPQPFALDKERLARFEREARLLASLNHPNIATIYGLEKSDGQQFLVMEPVEGETLAERIKKGPQPVDEALKVCKQIAEGLESAHEKGIIHRDLKPSNVKVTPEGKVKILDFGLAKTFQEEPAVPAADLSKSPTLTDRMTRPGVILGTAAYMSPEQARSRSVDKRTDIWAFGCVLYECLTGQPVLQGETVSDTLALILKGEPDWTKLPANTPPTITTLLRRCLQKDPSHRLQHIGDARIEIQEALTEGTVLLPTMPETKGEVLPIKRLRPAFLIGLVTGLVVGAIAAGIFLWTLMRSTLSEPRLIGRYTINLAADAPVYIVDNYTTSIAISPDGKTIVYSSVRDKKRQLYLRDIEESEAKPISGTEGASGPFFSPSGEWIGYFDPAARKLMKISLRGGAPSIICETTPAGDRGASWGSDDSIVFTPSYSSGLYMVSAAGGKPQAITTLDLEKKEKTHRFPQILPDDKTALFTIGTSELTSFDDASIGIVSFETGKRETLIEGGSNARYAPSGHIVYAGAGSLMAVPFDLKRLEVTGAPVRILDGVVTSDMAGVAHFSFSRSGSLIYVTGGPEIYFTKLVWIDRKGEIQSLPATPKIFRRVDCSPDGKRFALEVSGANQDIWIYEIEREILTRLKSAAGDSQFPIWTPDSKRVTYAQLMGELHTLVWEPADMSGSAEKLITSEHLLEPTSWSPNGEILTFTEYHPSTGADIWVLSIEGKREPQLFLKTSFNEDDAKFSPDGRWIAYDSNESGQNEVYVRPFPGPGGITKISTTGGLMPVWAPDGRELFYRIEDKMMVVAIDTKPEFIAGKPKLLFESPSLIDDRYGIAPDGQRFVMIEEGEYSAPPSQLNIILNWFEELKRHVPTGKK